MEYTCFRRENFFKAAGKCLAILILALVIPALWYYAAYQIQGDAFLEKAFAENFGRFLRIETADLGIGYDLGVVNPWYYYPITLITGFLPWTMLLFISLFCIRYKKPNMSIKDIFQKF